MPKKLTLADILARCVTAPNGCLIWTGQTGTHGYGQIGNTTPARRVWLGSGRQIPKGDRLRNVCGNRLCVSLDHWCLDSDYESVRFWAFVDRSGDCWLWTGDITRSGYSVFREFGGRRSVAHRWAYEATRGPIPEGAQLHHTCHTKHCVHPDHLVPVTARQNIRAKPKTPRQRTIKVPTKLVPVVHALALRLEDAWDLTAEEREALALLRFDYANEVLETAEVR